MPHTLPQPALSWTVTLETRNVFARLAKGQRRISAVTEIPHGTKTWCSQINRKLFFFLIGPPGGSAVKNPPANAGDTGSIPGLGRSHMPWGYRVVVPQ